MAESTDINVLAYCGIYCGGCSNFQHNINCAGCRTETELVADCPTRVCIQKKGLLHCGECAEFPCQMQKEFYEDGIPHHAQALKNILAINEMGLEKWLEFMQQQNSHA